MKEALSQANSMSGNHPTIKPGTVLGNRFKIVHWIGSGSIGDVFEAYDSHRSANIALKVVFPSIIEKEIQKEQLLKTIKIVCNLTHPKILTVYDVHQEQDMCNIVMEFLKGESLHKRIRERRENATNTEART